MATLREEIASIPGADGWWKRSAEQAFQNAAKDLKSRGMSDEEVTEMLSDLYHAVCSCFGE